LRATYRIRQLLAALTARVSEVDLAEVDAHLTPDARSLFRRMPSDGQAHALRVMRDLKHAGHTHPSLLAAALLHDAGKSAARITPLTRSMFVVLRRVAPRPLARWPAVGWRKPFAVLRDHPRTGAEWARAAGCDELAASLIARHQERLSDPVTREEDRLLKLLQDFDERN